MLKFVRKFKDLAIEGRNARQYNKFSREYRMGDFKEYANVAAKLIRNDSSILEVATGPGYFCIELAKLGHFKIIGIDISSDLIEIARDNGLRAGSNVEFHQGNASTMPFLDNVFDLVFCSWAMKNFLDPSRVLNEMYRVLKPNGKALIVDLNRDATSQDWCSYASNRAMKGVTAFLMSIAFSIQRRGAYSKGQFEEMFSRTPFKLLDIQIRGINLCAILSK